MKQTDRVPHKARGAAQSAGVPAQSGGTTKTSYPLMKYLSLLLAVALLFSGVTFARYLSNDRIDASVGIAAFDATYSIDRVNTTTFGNQDYWIEVGGTNIDQGAGTAITVGITLKNNGDTSVMPTLHLEGPKEYWDNIALQLTTALGVPAGDVLTPQLVIKDIVEGTVPSEDYGSLGGKATLALEGIVDTGLTATWTYEGVENKMTITKKTITKTDTKKTDTIDYSVYSVGFARKDSATGEIFPPIFVDCQKKTEIYSIDLELPALNVAAAQKNADGSRTAATQDVVVWLTWTNALANTSVSADRAFWGFEGATSTPESNLTGNMKGTTQFTFNNQYVEGSTLQTGDEITVLGYHYDVPGVPVVDANGDATGETTTVRVKETFASADGVAGKTEYFHVASLNDTDGNYVHDFKPVSDGSNIYQCQNKQNTGNRICIDVKSVKKLQNFDTVTLVSMVKPDNEEGYIKQNYAPIQQRAFGVSFRATFVQSSEVPNI